MRTALVLTFRIALVISCCSLAYLLFIFGHTEVAPPGRILEVTTVTAVSALVAGLLQWIGLPAAAKDEATRKKTKKKPPARAK